MTADLVSASRPLTASLLLRDSILSLETILRHLLSRTPSGTGVRRAIGDLHHNWRERAYHFYGRRFENVCGDSSESAR